MYCMYLNAVLMYICVKICDDEVSLFEFIFRNCIHTFKIYKTKKYKQVLVIQFQVNIVTS